MFDACYNIVLVYFPAPSFHHRARSPSPQPTTSPNKKDAAEHHSRDSHRRRHIDARGKLLCESYFFKISK